MSESGARTARSCASGSRRSACSSWRPRRSARRAGEPLAEGDRLAARPRRAHGRVSRLRRQRRRDDRAPARERAHHADVLRLRGPAEDRAPARARRGDRARGRGVRGAARTLPGSGGHARDHPCPRRARERLVRLRRAALRVRGRAHGARRVGREEGPRRAREVPARQERARASTGCPACAGSMGKTSRCRPRAVLFDLDGTLTDPKLGITRSIQYALRKRGIAPPDADALEPFIGPPLEQSFRERFGFDPADARRAVEDYREYFSPQGLYENEVYDGHSRAAARSARGGAARGLATSKPMVFAERILEHFDLGQALRARRRQPPRRHARREGRDRRDRARGRRRRPARARGDGRRSHARRAGARANGIDAIARHLRLRHARGARRRRRRPRSPEASPSYGACCSSSSSSSFRSSSSSRCSRVFVVFDLRLRRDLRRARGQLRPLTGNQLPSHAKARYQRFIAKRYQCSSLAQ